MTHELGEELGEERFQWKHSDSTTELLVMAEYNMYFMKSFINILSMVNYCFNQVNKPRMIV